MTNAYVKLDDKVEITFTKGNYIKVDDMTWACIYCGRHGESCTRIVHEEGCQLSDVQTP